MKLIYTLTLLHLFTLILANCPLGFFLEMSTGTCLQCSQVIEGCATCLSSHLCTSCNLGYGLFGDRCVKVQVANAYNPCPEGFAYDGSLGVCVGVPYAGQYVVYNEIPQVNNGWAYNYGVPYVAVVQENTPQQPIRVQAEPQVHAQPVKTDEQARQSYQRNVDNGDKLNSKEEASNTVPKSNDVNKEVNDEVKKATDNGTKESMKEVSTEEKNKDHVYNESRKNFDDRPDKDDKGEVKKDDKKDNKESLEQKNASNSATNSQREKEEIIPKRKVEENDPRKPESKVDKNNDLNIKVDIDKKVGQEEGEHIKNETKENLDVVEEKAKEEPKSEAEIPKEKQNEVSNEVNVNNDTAINKNGGDKKEVEEKHEEQNKITVEVPSNNQTNETQETKTDQIQNTTINNETDKEDNKIQNQENNKVKDNVQQEVVNSKDNFTIETKKNITIKETNADTPKKECNVGEFKTAGGECLSCNLLCKKCKGSKYNECIECVEGASPQNVTTEGTFMCACEPEHIFDMELRQCIKTGK